VLLLALVFWAGSGFAASATFEPLNPVPQGAVIGPESAMPGEVATLTYSAALATSCAVTQSGCVSAPVLAAAACSGVGPQQTCSASVTMTIPANAAPCVDAVTVTCQPGAVLSPAPLPNPPPPPPPPGDCSGLKPLPTPTAGKNWRPVLQSRVRWGDGTVSPVVNAADYNAMWTYPGNTPSWPGNSGLTTQPTGASPYMYFTEKFVVPASAVGSRVTWGWSGSGINSNASATISVCPGDFGQVGSQIPAYCRMNQNRSSSGLRTVVAVNQAVSTCTLKPGATYYLSFLPTANLPSNPYDLSVSSCDSSTLCSPWFVMTQ
jgi:hypothetical protein